jgi:hypothetical protein
MVKSTAFEEDAWLPFKNKASRMMLTPSRSCLGLWAPRREKLRERYWRDSKAGVSKIDQGLEGAVPRSPESERTLSISTEKTIGDHDKIESMMH